MQAMEGEILNPSAPVKGFGVRHGQVILQFFFYVIVFGIQSSLSITIVPMTYVSYADHTEHLPPRVMSDILTSYIYAFLVSELFGGWVCKRWGFKWPMVIIMVIISAFTLNLPSVEEAFGYQGLIFCRIIQGLSAGLAFSMPADFVSKWIPVSERTTLGTAVYASGRLGDVLGICLATYFSASQLGWQFVYTQYGYMAIIWAILMAIFGANSPEEYSKKISEAEMNHIVQNRGNAKPRSNMKIPWMQILSSMPFWAIVVAQLGASWMLFIFAENLPTYFNIYFKVGNVYTLVSVISLISWILSFPISGVAELLINEGKTTVEQSRKLFNTLGCLIPAVIFIYLVFIPQGNEFEGVAFMAIISVASIGTICGSKLNSNDISSNYAPIVFGIATWIGILFNIVMIEVFRAHIADNWKLLFLFTAVLLFATNAFYLKFASGEEENWDSYEEEMDESIDLSKSSAYVSCDEGKYLLFIKKN